MEVDHENETSMIRATSSEGVTLNRKVMSYSRENSHLDLILSTSALLDGSFYDNYTDRTNLI